MTGAELVVGVFVGGRGTRMGGVAKGLLEAPGGGEALAERALRLCAEVLPGAARVLVGEASAYAHLGCPALADAPGGVGPIGGLRALLLEARRGGRRRVIALSCDLPRFSGALLERLASEQPQAAVLAPRDGLLWQPLFARYDVDVALGAVDAALAAGERALQRVFARLAASELALGPEERLALVDWDRPEDVER